MAAAGRKPKEASQRRNRNPSTVDWVEVPNVPYSGPVPVELPRTRVIVTRNGQETIDLQPITRDWWDAVIQMPHCKLWSLTDWQFAVTTALVADAAYCGIAAAATELRNREKLLGTTAEFRKDLRIRYTDEEKDAPVAGVTSLEDYRDL